MLVRFYKFFLFYIHIFYRPGLYKKQLHLKREREETDRAAN